MTKTLTIGAITLFATALLASSALADPTTFAFSPGGLSQVTFSSEAPLETINGSSNAVTGSVAVDLAAPGAATGSVSFPVASLRTGIDMRDEHLHGEMWLNATVNENITFELTGVAFGDGATLANAAPAEATLTGSLTINGATHEVTTTASIGYYEIDDQTREMGGMTGLTNNVLRVNADFDIALADYGVSIPPPLALKVAETVTLGVRLTGVQQ